MPQFMPVQVLCTTIELELKRVWNVIETPNAFRYKMLSVCQQLHFQDPLMTVLNCYWLTRFLISEDHWMTSFSKPIL